MSKRHRRTTDRGEELLSRSGKSKGIVVRREPPPPTPPPEPLPPAKEITRDEPDEDPYIRQQARVVEQDEEDEDDFEADDFEGYLEELDKAEEEEEQVIEVRTLKAFLKGKGDPKQLRKIRYISLEDAQDFLESSGIHAFTEILFDESSGTFAIAVGDSPGQKKKRRR